MVGLSLSRKTKELIVTASVTILWGRACNDFPGTYERAVAVTLVEKSLFPVTARRFSQLDREMISVVFFTLLFTVISRAFRIFRRARLGTRQQCILTVVVDSR